MHTEHERLRAVERKLDRVIDLLNRVIRKGDHMSRELDELAAVVEANTRVDASAIELIEGIAAKLDEAKADPARIEALSQQLRVSAQSLAEAVAANTADEAE